MALLNQGVQDVTKIPIGGCNKLVMIDAAGAKVVFGSVKNVTIAVSQTRYIHTDNSKYQAAIGDFLMSVTGEITFDMEEWSDDNLAIVTGAAADADGGYTLGDKGGSERRIEFLVDDINSAEVVAVIAFRVKIYPEFNLNLSPGQNIWIAVKGTILQDNENIFGAAEFATGDIYPLVRINKNADSEDAYGLT